MTLPMDATVRREQVVVNDVRLRCATAGDPADPTVLLLHGFPEFWYSWRHQLRPLADEGFHVVAPDLRGYNRSEKPAGVDAYDLDELVADAAGLAEHFGGSAHVVGHDWGGLVAWQTAADRPDVVDRLAVLNAPHLDRYLEEVRRPRQALRSWYVLVFQLPWLPERLLRAGDAAALDWMFRDTPAVEGAFPPAVRRRYREAFLRPGVATAALNYYRALARRVAGRVARRGGRPWTKNGSREMTGEVTPETLLVWGEADPALDAALTEGVERWVPDLRVERLPVGHWVQAEAPERVSELLIEHFE
jgi:pimeloyl-ACP methyl ester carboxylesterase